MLVLTYWQISFSKCWNSNFVSQVCALRKWSILQHISVCSVKKIQKQKNMLQIYPQGKNSSLRQLYSFIRNIDQHKNTLISQLYQLPRSPFSQNTYHTSYFRPVNISKILRRAFLQNMSRSSRLQMLSKIGVLKNFANFTGRPATLLKRNSNRTTFL